jgi:hypothetical protein
MMGRNKEFKPSLAGRPITHPDIAHLEAIIENNKRECRAIDKILMPHAYKNVHVRREVATAHDIASSNPLLRELLRQMQK